MPPSFSSMASRRAVALQSNANPQSTGFGQEVRSCIFQGSLQFMDGLRRRLADPQLERLNHGHIDARKLGELFRRNADKCTSSTALRTLHHGYSLLFSPVVPTIPVARTSLAYAGLKGLVVHDPSSKQWQTQGYRAKRAGASRLKAVTPIREGGSLRPPWTGMRPVGAFVHQGQRTAARGRLRWQIWQFLDLSMTSPLPERPRRSNRQL